MCCWCKGEICPNSLSFCIHFVCYSLKLYRIFCDAFICLIRFVIIQYLKKKSKFTHFILKSTIQNYLFNAQVTNNSQLEYLVREGRVFKNQERQSFLSGVFFRLIFKKKKKKNCAHAKSIVVFYYRLVYDALNANSYDPLSTYEDKEKYGNTEYRTAMKSLQYVCEQLYEGDVSMQGKVLELLLAEISPLFGYVIGGSTESSARQILESHPQLKNVTMVLLRNCFNHNSGSNIRNSSSSSLHNAMTAEDKYQVAIIGGSISGLLHALSIVHPRHDNDVHSKRANMHVSIYEKRQYYERDVWFDIYGQPFYRSVEHLNTYFAFEWSDVEKQVPKGAAKTHAMQTYVMRAQILERFLAKLLYWLRVPLHYGCELIDLTTQVHHNKMERRRRRRQLVMRCQHNLRYVHFDMLVACDGTNSKVRALLQLPFEALSHINLTLWSPSPKRRQWLEKKEHLHQLSLIADFKPVFPQTRFNPSGGDNCPPLKLGLFVYVEWIASFVHSMFILE
ncbi:hypothetical protein RFI_30886 [Reticulomyxa filosa]|uniref:FAD-binding domain-containing protein n=1 Tax=Reticulomyxa filosa TaxID=46433 RepID=X6LY20_RETFI|nr:hypothetical protein RFI_30886 [Reticulomyxa filosa]|eukprot:ETO06504.1 hypothetical protein RFI_30886 [Reticulomyxa filosa]